MSYDQAMKHWKNHRKDRFFQPCAGPVFTRTGYQTGSEIEDRRSIESMSRILTEDHGFPIWLKQDSLGFWYEVPSNDIAGALIESREALEQFAEDYVFSQVSAKQVTDENSF